MNTTIPFTYCLYHIPSGRRYYGVKTGKNCCPSDLWTKYFSSSSVVKSLIEQDGSNSFIPEIRKVFTDVTAAKEWEAKVLRRLRVDVNDMWLNKHIQCGKFICTGLSDETKNKIRKKMIGRVMTDEHKQHMSESAAKHWEGRRANGWAPPQDSIDRCQASRKKIPHDILYSEERNAKMRASKKGTKRHYLPDGSFIMVKNSDMPRETDPGMLCWLAE